MTVREVMQCCTSSVWITLGEDSRNCDLDILVENSIDAEDVLSEWILDHDVHLMHCSDDRLIISLFTANDVKEKNHDRK